MRAVISDFPLDLELEYLQSIEALTAEFKVGMAAVGMNEIAAFEQSVSIQKELSARLCRLAGQMGMESAKTDEAGARFEHTGSEGPLLAQRIQLAARSLQATGVTYAALLKHCGDSARLFHGLCGTYTEHYQGSAAKGTQRPKWCS